MNLQLEWVETPRPDWVEDIESMAEGYPFEKRKKDIKDEDSVGRCRATWGDQSPSGEFLAAYFEAKLVGWIKLHKSDDISRYFDHPYRIAEWELIQRNRDDIRGQLLDAIRRRYPDSIIEFSQPSQNRTGRNFYLKQPDVREGPTYLQLGRKLSEATKRDTSPAGDAIKPLTEGSVDELPFDLQSAGMLSVVAPLLTDDQLDDLVMDKLESYRNDSRRGGFYSVSGSGNSCLILYDYETNPPAGATTTGRIPYLNLGDVSGESALADELIGRTEQLLRKGDVEYVEAKLEDSSSAEYDALVGMGFTALSKRMYFFRVPESVTLPGERRPE